MLYRIFIYKSAAATGSAMAVDTVNIAISKNSEREWKGNYADHYMEDFDVNIVKKQIENLVGDKCIILIKYSPDDCDNLRPYIYIATSYKVAGEILPWLHAVATSNGLALYDAETKKSFFKDLIDETLISIKTREQQIANNIRNDLNGLWKIRKLSCLVKERDKESSYIVTIKKDVQHTFEERVQEFYDCLKNSLIEGEELICENKAFTIKKEWYSITYCLEGYKKFADKIGYFENDTAMTELVHRMSVEMALKWVKGCSKTEKDDIYKRLNFIEMVKKYPNPADRFVASVNITKAQRKELFDIRYSGMGYYGSEILFHIVTDDFYEDYNQISVLKIEEESASFILPFIEDVYPYFYERYYLTENHLPVEMWEKIVERLIEAKSMILNNPFDSKLEKYINRFNLFVLSNDRNDYDMIRNEPRHFLYKHRYDVAHLYDVFIKWSDEQFYHYGYEDRMFNIQGP